MKNEKNKIGPLGITSFLDCIALRIPVIASDNVCFAKDIKKYNLGKTYKTGDASSLLAVMQEMFSNSEEYGNLKKSMEEYEKERNISKYSKELKKIITKILRSE